MGDNITIKDFGKVVRPQRKLLLAGEEIDVSVIPSRVAIEMTQLADQQDKSSEDTFMQAVDLVSRVCQSKNPKITVDWLLDNTDFELLMDVIDFVLEPVKHRAEAAGGGKQEAASS